MGIELRLPDVGEGVAEGEIVRWLVSEGESVREDQPVVEVLTDKADVEIPSPVMGTLVRILARPGQVVKVGDVIAVLEPAGAKGGGGLRGDEAPAPPAAGPAADRPPHEAAPPRAAAGEVLATPAVRGLAKELGVEIARVRGTGPGGRVTEEDVRRASRLPPERPGGPPAPAPREEPAEERIPFRGRRRMAAKKTALSKATIPHALIVDEADATSLLAARGALREIAAREGVRITILPFIVQAVVTALRKHPAMNASLDETTGEIVLKRRHDIGIAVDAEEGLIVPVVRDAGEKTIVELAREIERLAEGARRGDLPLSDLTGGTFTVTSIGSIGGLFSYPVINPPEAGILAVHKIVRRPVVREGAIVPRDMAYLSLSFDHRIVDGGTATRFLNDVILRIASLPAE